MAKVNLEINGRKYALGCDEGEEDRLLRLGNDLDTRVRALADQFGQIGDVRLLVMAGITMSDEISEMRTDLEGQAAAMTETLRKDADRATHKAVRQENDAINALASAAEKIEKLAAGLRRDDA
ncbi:cell division protein ZapA [Robiginitomaculum antarcticum]|uniref:cell division protein ZapA n=1 Tax=Robiginitomaculum antarcticum TaxID=437507 RepID=UPI00035E5B23|nr:cell division protein ZapA [Robiginitomaculum antarcticum]